MLPVDEKGEIVYGYYDENCELLQEITDTQLTCKSYTPVEGKDVYYVFVPNSVKSIDLDDGNYGVFENAGGKFGKLEYVLFQDGTKLSGSAHVMFYRCTSLVGTNIGTVVNTSGIKDMAGMFDTCSSITSLDLSNFDTSEVTNMSYMFYSCSSLTSLDLSNFDTNKVTDMSGMFRECSGLTSLDLSNFDTSKVTDMSYMFYKCSRLTSLDVSNFDTSKVTNMHGMFNSCSSLNSLDVSNFDTRKVTDMRGMFYGCNSLTDLDLSGFDVSELDIEAMGSMFGECFVNNDENNTLIINKKALSIIIDNSEHSHLVSNASLDDSSDDFSDTDLLRCKVTGCEFPEITDVEKIIKGSLIMSSAGSTISDLGNTSVYDEDGNIVGRPVDGEWPIPSYGIYLVKNNGGIVFNYIAAMKSTEYGYYDEKYELRRRITENELNYNTYDDSNACYYVFVPNSVKSIDVFEYYGVFDNDYEKFDKLKYVLFEDGTKLRGSALWMFFECWNLVGTNIGTVVDTSGIEDMGFMFYACSGLTSLDLSNFDTSSVEYDEWSYYGMINMFYGCSSLTTLDLSSFDISELSTDAMESMFTDSYIPGVISTLKITGDTLNKILDASSNLVNYSSKTEFENNRTTYILNVVSVGHQVFIVDGDDEEVTGSQLLYGREDDIALEEIYDENGNKVEWDGKIPMAAAYGVYTIRDSVGKIRSYFAVVPRDKNTGKLLYGYYDKNCKLLHEITGNALTYTYEDSDACYVFVPNTVKYINTIDSDEYAVGVFDNCFNKFNKLKYVLFQDGTEKLIGNADAMFNGDVNMLGISIPFDMNITNVTFCRCFNDDGGILITTKASLEKSNDVNALNVNITLPDIPILVCAVERADSGAIPTVTDIINNN